MPSYFDLHTFRRLFLILYKKKNSFFFEIDSNFGARSAISFPSLEKLIIEILSLLNV